MSSQFNLEAARVRLRELRVTDLDAIHDYGKNPAASRFQPWGPNSEEETRAFLNAAIQAQQAEPRMRYALAIEMKDSNHVVGAAELKMKSANEGEISYIVNPSVWSQGIATESARLLIDFGFDRLKLRRIVGTCDPRNDASAKVLRKIGMKFEKRIPHTLRLRDGWRDSDVYAIDASVPRVGRRRG